MLSCRPSALAVVKPHLDRPAPAALLLDGCAGGGAAAASDTSGMASSSCEGVLSRAALVLAPFLGLLLLILLLKRLNFLRLLLCGGVSVSGMHESSGDPAETKRRKA